MGMSTADLLPFDTLMALLEAEIKDVETVGMTPITDALMTIRDLLKHLD